ncbi:hypothetical protein SAMN05660226_01040 [Parapedobacter luteus]|uniref:Uncharacterized protein n=1 Tax=Parapedobacter luteus TaxID=623280 RepID=A0A1T5AT15_9SPHI|nr:hypothetical protein [Parapedobacter luteus]SKB38118.1 hypothetical protein SAMN05660226_01040 [Parapedobacter luteus]
MKFIFLQATPSGEIVAFVFILAISIAVFFAIRGILLWYWKVDTLVKNQEEANQILRSIARMLELREESTSKSD